MAAQPGAGPNESGATTLIGVAVLRARQAIRPDWKELLLDGLRVVLPALTSSRSELLARRTFTLLSPGWVRPARLLGGAPPIAALLPARPQTFWARMLFNVAVERRSFKAFSGFQRLRGWRTVLRVVRDHARSGVE